MLLRQIPTVFFESIRTNLNLRILYIIYDIARKASQNQQFMFQDEITLSRETTEVKHFEHS